ncbi:MAG: DUF3566 domain-containing protein [Fidelibacterota bacterium]
MQYEIKNISLSSVLKTSFLTLMTTGTIFFTFTTLMVLRLLNSVTESMAGMGEVGVESFAEMSLGGILMSSFIFGIMLSVMLVFWIAILIIFYNFFAKYLGGIVLDLKEKYGSL